MSDLNVYTTSAINALTPITGDMVIDSDLNAVKLYDGAAWRTWNSDSVAVPFENRWGASFDGSSNFLSLGTNFTPFDFGTGDFTVSQWFKPNSISAGGYQALVGSHSGTGDTWTTFVRSDGLFIFGGGALIGGGTIVNGQWYHGVATRSSGVVNIFLNGSNVASVANTGQFNSAALPHSSKIGADNAGNPKFHGLIDDAAIFNTALSASDITKIYNGTAPNGKPTNLTDAASYDTDRTSNLKGYWRMGDDSSDTATSGGSIATITDSSGNGNDATQGTASSQPTFSDLTGETIYV